MGQSQNTHHHHPTASADFQAAEALAFADVGQALGQMPGCGLEDLEQGAYSYLCQSFASSGIPVREQWARRKAAAWAGWWHTRHTAARQTRPHSQYSAAQALRGRVVAAIRKKGRANWQALQAQLARDRGGTVAEVAGELGCSRRYIFQLSKRKFPKLVALVLALALGVNVPKSSALATSEIQGIDQKEPLRPFTLDDVRPAAPPPLGKIDDIDDDFDQIRAELAGLYPAWAADLAKLPG